MDLRGEWTEDGWMAVDKLEECAQDGLEEDRVCDKISLLAGR